MRPLLTVAACFCLATLLGCPSTGRDTPSGPEITAGDPVDTVRDAEARSEAREKMVTEQIEARGVSDPRVLAAMRSVPRHLFMPQYARHAAYEDHPVPIGHDQTISQPFIVAYMSELAKVKEGDRVLEIGTGSGYQAAILDEMGAEVFSIEIVEPLARSAEQLLRELGHDRVKVRYGDGYEGWPEEAPFDVVMLTASPPEIPDPLIEQLAPGGRLIAPVGRHYQELVVITSGPDGLVGEKVLPVRFVPMTGRAQSESPPP